MVKKEGVIMSRFIEHFKMNEDDILEYVSEKINYFDKNSKLNVREIGDGNINYVFKVWDSNSKKSLIIKHADKLLRSSGRELDVDRNRIEANVLKEQYKECPTIVPKVYLYDPVMCTIVMEDISEYSNLRKELLERKTFPKLADDISSFIVNTTVSTTDIFLDSDVKKRKVAKYINGDLCKISEDLVFTEPYIDYKGRNIISEENLEFIKQNIYNDDRLLLEAGKLKNNFMNNAQALLHGDLHSGSIFVNQNGTKVLDPEFAFYGPIGYDLGNVVGNLFFAWINARVTEQDEKKLEVFESWISATIEDVVDLFKDKFVRYYENKVTDVLAKNTGYMEWYLGEILSDTAGSVGLEIIRRVVGDSKVVDITGIEDKDDRIKAERLLITLGKEMIMNRGAIVNGKDYVNLLKNNSKKNYQKFNLS